MVRVQARLGWDSAVHAASHQWGARMLRSKARLQSKSLFFFFHGYVGQAMCRRQWDYFLGKRRVYDGVVEPSNVTKLHPGLFACLLELGLVLREGL
mmetsp:Transcript_1757/g.3387  ORF Transcript_1757/g.3387 Transcript_1757/m.3387 type:complete len:96 (+) Transcript_1757:216-503(+)